MGLVSTGQMTITDHNDGKNIVAVVVPSLGTSQAYSKDESTVVYNPDWSSTPNVLTARVYAGSGADVAASLTNRKWSTNLGASLGTGTSYSVSANLGLDSVTYYFEGDYTDPTTGLLTHVIAPITLIRNKLGTNAVFLRTRGVDVIEASTTATKNLAASIADLTRASGVDNSGITYKWFVAPFAAADQLDANHALVTSGAVTFRTTAQSAAITTPIPVQAAPITAAPADGAWADVKELIIREDAVSDIGFFMVQAKDADGTIYQAFFTVYDISDPYDVKLNSTAGDKFQNGIGTTNVTPEVWYGDSVVASLTGWVFNWTLKDKTGAAAGFVNTTKTPVAKSVTANTTTTVTINGTFAGAPVAIDLIKAIKPDGSIKWYEVASVVNTGNAVVTIKTASPTTAWVSTALTASELVGASLFVANPTKQTSGAAAITITGDDIDVKGTIFCAASRP